MKTGRVRFLLSFATAMLALTASGACVAQVQKDREFQECPECPVMVGIPAGTFIMGSPHTENGRFDSEGPQHEVAIKAFALGKYDVTSEQFLTFLRETGYQPQACSSILDMKWNVPGHGRAYAPYEGEPPRWPAVCLDWRDAEKYIAWLNDKVRAAHPTLNYTNGAYRLPSEAEWEYAARAGTATARWWGNDITSARPIVTGAEANGTIGSWLMSIASGPTLSGSTACSATPGNGLPIAGIGISWARRRMVARGPRGLATSTSFVADHGAICRFSCAQPRAAAVASTAETTTIPVLPAFASRATCHRKTTSARRLVGSDRGPYP